MSEPLFISQGKLEAWMGDGKVTFEDNVLTLLEEGVSYELAPAVKILSLLDGADDAGLLGQLRSLAELEAIGAEHFADSVILGDTAYQCEEGFVGTQQAVAPAAAAPAPVAPAPSPAPPVPAAAAPVAAPSPAAPAPASAAPAPASTNATPATSDEVPDEDKSDMDLLTEFMLKNL